MSLGEARHLHQVFLARGKLVAGAQVAADVAHDGGARQHLGRLPAIDSEREGAAHARIVERLLLGVERHEQRVEPRALLNHDLVAERPYQSIAVGRRHAAELGHDLPALQRVDEGGALREDGVEAIEVGQVRA